MNMSYKQRLEQIIPGGAHTYSRGSDQFSSNTPQILTKGNGCTVWGPDGAKYLDYGMALRSVTLGYSHPGVNEAAIKQIHLGNNLTRPSLVELEAAEKMVELIPGVEMVKFAKNGSNVTSAAVKLARAFTSREMIAFPSEQPFFSFDDWFIGSTVMNRGTHEKARSAALKFEYGNIESLRELFQQHQKNIAGVIMEAATVLTPCSENCAVELTSTRHSDVCTDASHNFVREAQELCQAEGAVFILDEMITGFRWGLRGAAHYYDLKPDLITFGKAMANGFSVAVVGGRKEIMELGGIDIPGMERTFLLSSTHGAEMSGLGAFLGAMKVYESEPVIEHLWSYGSALKRGFNERIKESGLQRNIAVLGPDISLALEFKENDGELSGGLRTLFQETMSENGVLMPWIAVSLAHGETELNKTFDAFENSLSVLSQAVDKGFERFIKGPIVKPVFRKFN